MRYHRTATPTPLCPPYVAGDSITYRAFGGELRTVRVTARHADIKNGLPGFDGVLLENIEPLVHRVSDALEFVSVWGYDVQIVSVTKGGN